MDWFRWYNGSVNDPKWRVIAQRAGVRVADVVSVWAVVLETAAEGEERGTLDSFVAEDVAAALDLEAEQVDAIWAAMEGKVRQGPTLTGWPKRQPKREGDHSTERVRAYRERKRGETQRNATKRSVTLGNARGEESREELTTTTTPLSSSAAPNVDVAVQEKATPSKTDIQVREVFEHWQTRTGHQRARLTGERKKKIRARLQTYEPADLKSAIDAAVADPFLSGDNDRGRRYDDLTTILRNDTTTDRWLHEPNANGKRAPPKTGSGETVVIWDESTMGKFE